MQSCGTILGVIRLRSEGATIPECEKRFNIGSGTTQTILKRFAEFGKSLNELEEMESSAVENLFYPPMERKHRKIPEPDFDGLFESVQASGKKVTKSKIWEEYHQREPNGYCRSQMLEYYNRYLFKRFGPGDLTMGVNRIPGERIYIDYCGDKGYIHIRELSQAPDDYTEQQEIHIFLTACGYSGKLYAEAALDEKQEQFNSATARALAFYGAVPRYLVPDNLRTGVTENTRDSVIINASYQDLEAYYNTIVLPPPYRKPRGKAVAERYVQVIQRKVIEKIEAQYVFKDLDEVNEIVREIIEKENANTPKGYKQSHNELFELYDLPAMKPLTEACFISCDYSYCASVPNNYHVHYDGHFYSVPNQFYKAEVIIKATQEEVILCDINNREITRHKRCYIPTMHYITKPEHMPANHRFFHEVNQRDSTYYLNWAEEIGSNMKQLIFTILKSAKHDEQMYISCNGILHMCEGVPRGICEEAAADCVRNRNCVYSGFRKNLSDQLSMRKQVSITASLPDVEEVWGKDYYE